ncbi:MAG: twin-arginine translocase TatA/TatE family subunit [Thiofilum sp.]|uniref:twin-arginine translocase TatA/TatE family subunit n=1 Tax=Thiofilum sp. TaxID=2212733 RepID=UPI0025E85F31|nr:twin-arginine translocase TatA/TatE family subunit [Thiofilum sp.]MBK8452700.1 twin-arginine translocase TatA/TatE family subunit [Thiofilum sp.]
MHFSPLQLVLILVIVILLFGTKKLRNMGGDLGEAFKNFRRAVKDGDEAKKDEQPTETATNQLPPQTPHADGRVIEGQATQKDKVS